jgi:lipid A biosynthesis lauroyl/palmitoleoyl acyltransferase
MSDKFSHPRYWGGWVLVSLLKALVLLPYKWQMNIGKSLGALGYKYAKRRKHIAMSNLKACFPEKSLAELEKDCKKSFESIGMSGIETIIAWFMSDKRFNNIKFEDNIHQAFKDRNKNNEQVLILGSHFTCMEVIGRYMGTHYDNFNFVYQKHKNPFFEYIMTSSRERYAKKCLQRKNVMAIVKTLRRGESVWYAPDQDFGNERSIFVPFFNIPCSTLVATPWLSKMGKAPVMPCYYVRKDDLSGYEMHSSAPWEDFPTGNNYDDALRYNIFLEDAIRKHPDQYLWQHRRFKTRPEGEDSIY